MKRLTAVLLALLFAVPSFAATDYYDNLRFRKTIQVDGTTALVGVVTTTGALTVGGAVTATGDVNANGAIVGDGATVISGVLLDTEDVTAANVLTAAECGGVFFLNSATEFQTTLPAISTVPTGCWFEFYVAAAPAAASYTIITGNSLENVLHGGFVEREVDTGDDGPFQAAGDTITIVDGVAVVSDHIRMVSNGSLFYVTGVANADGGLTITQAD